MSREDRLRWTLETVDEVAPGVYRIPLPLPNDGLQAVNTYALVGDNEIVMIDAGWALAESRERLARSLAKIGAGLGDIRQFLVTHIHRDHYMQAIALREEYGLKVALGAGERDSLLIELNRGHDTPPAFGRRLIRAGAQPLIDQLARSGLRPPQDGEHFAEPDEWLSHGQILDLGSRQLEAIATPGHTPGHVVFADRTAGLLFAGDHVLPQITPSIGFVPDPGPLPLGDFLESLRLVRKMPDLVLLPAHGPVGPSVHARVDELLDHHDARLALTEQALRDGPRTAYEVAAAIPWTSRGRKLAELDLVNQMLAVLEAQCHLDLLAARGQVTAALDQRVELYQLAAPLA